MKLCSDCKWFNENNDRCDHSSATMLDYVHGKHRQYTAQTHRSISGGTKDCGPQAAFFEDRCINITPSLVLIPRDAVLKAGG